MIFIIYRRYLLSSLSSSLLSSSVFVIVVHYPLYSRGGEGGLSQSISTSEPTGQ